MSSVSSVMPFGAATSVTKLKDDSWSANLHPDYCVGAGMSCCETCRTNKES